VNVEIEEDIGTDGRNPHCPSCLYIASTGILPKYRNQGFGSVMKSWQVSYARYHRFSRIVTNTRQSNQAMIDGNRRAGFQVLRTTPRYYEDPCESTVVMELSLDIG
jgi:ribosomal protein S18 acetylase RimI-like enzyme